jgi:hypothetical protein
LKDKITKQKISNGYSVRGCKCAQIFAPSNCHANNYPMKSKSREFRGFDDYAYTVGIPNQIRTDNAGNEYAEEWKHVIKEYLMQQ